MSQGFKKGVSFFLLMKMRKTNLKKIILFRIIRSDRTRIWNAVELYNLYNPENEASSSSRKYCRILIKHLLDYFNGALVSFHARGYAKLICFKDHARGVLKLAQRDSTEDSIEQYIPKAKTLFMQGLLHCG